MEPSPPGLPPRILHLAGGLRAVDARDGQIGIHLSLDVRLAQYPVPPYAALYSAMPSLGLHPLGVEFVYGGTYANASPPDWQCIFPTVGFGILAEQRAWQEIRTAAQIDKHSVLADFASRTCSYLALLPIRVFQLSDAYNRMLRLAGDLKPSQLFDNIWKPHLEAAIHGYLADAASFRDLLAEGVWQFILGGRDRVTTLSSFLKKANKNPNLLVQRIIESGDAGGWLKIFTDLRNDVIHVAPVGDSRTLHLCQARMIDCGATRLTVMHYPLLAADGSIYRLDETNLDFTSEKDVRKRIEEFQVYCHSSIDALDYVWKTTDRFVALLKALRDAGNFRQERVTITDADLAGEVTILSGKK